MVEYRNNLSHYRGLKLARVTEKQRKEALAQVLRERKEKHDSDEKMRERLYTERHAARMQDFRNQTSKDDRFTEEEKQQIIKASWDW
jgi:hypothetical protein